MTTEINQDTRARFDGIIRLYGTRAVKTLQNNHVLIIGIGGVGSWVAEALARSAIGNITLMDLDDVCISNTNRQLHATQQSIGRSKIDVMSERLLQINPQLKVHAIHDFIDGDNLEEYISQQFDLVIDAIDAVMVKTKLINFCKWKKIPIITVGSAGGKRDPQKIISSDLSKTKNDPLLSKVRNNLRRLHHFSRNPKQRFTITAVYSTEQMTYPDDAGETCTSKEFMTEGARLDCSQGFGAATMVTGTFAFIAASEAIKKLLKKARSSSPCNLPIL
ncbi:MAG: tRNA A37 threonylcarbamoyladenosine dehydratase [Candidatus Endobugula sp.]|jgi:tRNA A37 threonylcarbamoyladenosine dehydratase